jgi:hypothetical protein
MRLGSILALIAAAAMAQVKVTNEATRVHIEIDGKPYTDFFYKGAEVTKPYLWPLRAASGTMVTRHFPMETVEGEPTDHPHQRGLWFAHESVNGVDFWNNEASYKAPPPRGRIVVTGITGVTSGRHEGRFTSAAQWMDPSGAKLLDEMRVTRIITQGDLRIIDLDITLTAATKVSFGDAKDGTLGIRLVPELQEDKVIKEKGKPDRTVPGAPGIITNASGGEHEKAVWGKPSDWVDYSGEIGAEPVGIAILDHPLNTRRARWHVRAYGLFAANPFGDAAFNGAKPSEIGVALDPGASLHFRYRIVIHPGGAASAGIANLWDEFKK